MDLQNSFSVLSIFMLLVSTSIGQYSSPNPCKDDDVVRNTDNANVVISGTVKKLVDDVAHSTNQNRLFKGEVEIKRVFKGDNLVDSVAKLKPGLLRQHQFVMVEGIGDPEICENEIHERETKIFMLNQNGNGELKLNSSLLPLTMYNLDYVDAVVRHIPFTTEKPKTISPCYLYFCPFGAVCHANKETGQPMCVCEQRCSKVFAPVCGSDGATYTNLCYMDRASCLHKKVIKVLSQGPCGMRDPCEGHVCRFGAECMSSIDGTTPRCQCPLDCPDYGDSVGSKPVCGNDGNDYENMCELRKAACYQLRDIRVKYYGKCDPCEGFQCEHPKVCQVNAQREPECRCNYICQSSINLVCGSDGRTYSNACLLRKQECKSRKDIRVMYEGKCSPDNNPCDGVQCGLGEECSVDKHGTAVCVCPPPCEPILRRVCGSNNITYDNMCELQRRACLEKIEVKKVHQGPCGSDSPCRGHRCDYGAVCVEHGGMPTCVCPQCSEEYKPVCGSNGITYENECKMRQDNCEREENVKKVGRGPCDGCGSENRCEFYAVCETMNGKQRCVCPTSCVAVNSPVCGSDGKTYPNKCELMVASCRRKQFLSIVSTGSCDACRNINCKFGAKCENGKCVCPILCPNERDPVCGSDERTYMNLCELKRHACKNSLVIEEEHTGPCESDVDLISISGSGESGDFDWDDEDKVKFTKKAKTECNDENCHKFGGTCEFDNLDKKCSCNFVCGAVRELVCGSDKRTYGNRCMMLQQSCIQKQIISEVPAENCDGFDDDEPCDGNKPLLNLETGNEYDCSPGGEICPSNSYCHATLTFHKCCKDEANAIKECSETDFGCCKDGKTPASGPRSGGCPNQCKCNPVGAYSRTCDARTLQCSCKPGVGGKRCDRCEIGYWGLHRIGPTGNAGCIPCSCNKFGSSRDDCEQMTGRCMCHPNIIGMKCDRCRNGNTLGPDGCRDQFTPTSCQDLSCQYGARCEEVTRGRPECVCDVHCDEGSQSLLTDIVCGSDGQNYGSQCQMQQFGCRLQKDIYVVNNGPCKGAPPTPVTTPPPVTRPRKTTRHINGKEEDRKEETDKEKPPANKTDGSKDYCTGSNIEDLCLSDEDCCPKESYCYNGLCYCKDGYIASIDNKNCFEVTTNPPVKGGNKTDACSNKPCAKGAECELDDLLGFRCVCALTQGGPFCDEYITFTIPSFSGRSYLTMPYMEKTSKDLNIEIVFNTLNKDGIILFNAKNKNGSGDFVSLAMKDGYLEFRFDLGAGAAIIQSRYPLEIGRIHKVVARRQLNMGYLQVDDEENVAGSTPITHTSLDLNEPLYLGFIPNAAPDTFERVGVDLGLVGCVEAVSAGNSEKMYEYNLDLHAVYSDVLTGRDVTQCGRNPCKSMPCQNGATCIAKDESIFECLCKEGYRGIHCEELMNPCGSEPCQYGGTCVPTTTGEGFFCQCPRGREGLRCEKESLQEVVVPQFTGDSYMSLPIEENIIDSMAITVWFKPHKGDGVILFTTQSPGGKGDFISLNLENKKLVYTFFLGSGVGRLESRKHIHLDKWHEVTISRSGRDGKMVIDKHPPVLGEAVGPSSELNINMRPLYVGGYKRKEDIPLRSEITDRFNGAIQRIIINGRTIDGLMSSALAMLNISVYNGPPCNINPCMNGGVCVPKLDSFECRCPSRYVGNNCEQRFEHIDKDQPLSFDSMTYMTYPNEVTKQQEGQRSNRFLVTFRAKQPNGILLLQTGGSSVVSDYLVVYLRDGFVELSYNLGKEDKEKLFIIKSTINVLDGEWHSAHIMRQEREGTLKVDEEKPVVASSTNGVKQLDTDGYLWVGGRSTIPFGLPVTDNFVGCIDTIEVNGQQLQLVDDRNGNSTSLSFCT